MPQPAAPSAWTARVGPSRGRLVELVVVLAWVFAVAVVGNTLPWPTGRWPMTGWQVGLYALQAAPVLLLRPRLLRCFRGPARWLVPALGLALATTAAAAVVGSTGATVALLLRLTATATVEELVFRGWLWQLGNGERRPVAATGLTAVVFALYHLPALAAEAHGQVVRIAVGLLPLLAFGVVFALLRVATRGLAVPAAVHLAFDIVPIGK